MFDSKKLLKPISVDEIFGEDLSFSREIDAIVDARRFDDPSLDQGEWVTEIKTADWPFVILLVTIVTYATGLRCDALRGCGKTKSRA